MSGNKHTKLVNSSLDIGPKIPQGTKHRVENREQESLIFIEVQHGSSFDEEDIVRIEDDYNRK